MKECWEHCEPTLESIKEYFEGWPRVNTKIREAKGARKWLQVMERSSLENPNESVPRAFSGELSGGSRGSGRARSLDLSDPNPPCLRFAGACRTWFLSDLATRPRDLGAGVSVNLRLT